MQYARSRGTHQWARMSGNATYLKFPNAVGRRNTQMSTKEHKCESANLLKSATRYGNSQTYAKNGRNPVLPFLNFSALPRKNRYRPKGVFGIGVGNSQNASEMRQKCVKMGLVLLGKEERPKCVRNPSKIASKMRQKCAEHLWGRTPFGQYRKKTLKLIRDFCPLPNPLKPRKEQRKSTNNQRSFKRTPSFLSLVFLLYQGKKPSK